MRAPHLQHDRPSQCSKCRDVIGTNQARGMCLPCYGRCATRGRLMDHARRLRTRDEVMSDWAILRAEGYTKRQAAERLGVSFDAFDRAFHRARRAGDPRALPALPRMAVCA